MDPAPNLTTPELATIFFVFLVLAVALAASVFVGWRIWKHEKEIREQRGAAPGENEASAHEYFE